MLKGSCILKEKYLKKKTTSLYVCDLKMYKISHFCGLSWLNIHGYRVSSVTPIMNAYICHQTCIYQV